MKNSVVIILFFIILLQSPSFAYIDPGTGSMLFSLILGAIGSVYFIFYTIFLKIKNLCFQKKDLSKNSKPFVIYSEGKQYYNLFKPILDEANKRNLDLTYYTSSDDDPLLKEEYKTIKTQYIGKNIEAYFKLAFLKTDICLMTTPGLDVLQLKRSKQAKYYCHIFHAIADLMNYRLFSLDYYDGILCDGSFQIPAIRELEKKRNLKKKDLIPVGCCYMDFLKTRLKTLQIKKENFSILIAPTWGQDSLLNKFDSKLIDNLLNENWNIIIRPHPQSLKVEKKLIDKLVLKYKNNKNIAWDFEIDNLPTMAKSDILISDFSGIIFDWVFLFEKPFLYSMQEINDEIYDYSDLDDFSFRKNLIKSLGKEIDNNSISNIASLIKNLNQDSDFQNKIQSAKKIVWEKQGESAKNIVDFIVQKQKELSNDSI